MSSDPHPQLAGMSVAEIITETLEANQYVASDVAADRLIEVFAAAGLAVVPVEIVDLTYRALKFYERSWDGHPGNSGPGGIDPQEPEIEPSQELYDDGGECARIALGMLAAATARQGQPEGEG